MNYYVFSFLNIVPVLIPFLVGLIKYRYLNPGLKRLFYLVCFALFSESVSRILVIFMSRTLIASHFYVPLEFFFYSILYSWFLKEFIKPRYIYAVIAIFTLSSAINSLFFQSTFILNNYVRAFEALIFVIYSILYFYKLLNELQIKNLWKEPMIWVNIGVLFCFSGNFFIFILSNRILEMPIDIAKAIFYIPTSLYQIAYLLFAYGLFQVKKITP
jgi:hypothetical protein